MIRGEDCMGKILSLTCSESGRAGVVLRKARGKFYLENLLSGEDSSIPSGGVEIYLSCFYPDLIVEKIELPPVEDTETLEFLIKRKLTEIRGLQEEIVMCYREIPWESTQEYKVFTVFAMPREVYDHNDLVKRGLQDNIAIFTVPFFSLAGISGNVGEEITLFHVYLNDNGLIITVSRGGYILYTRGIRVSPAILESEELSSFLYENTNMTYMFITQRQGIKVDLILVSGKLRTDEAYIQSLVDLTGSGIATPLVPPNIRDVNVDVFHDFLTAFGSLFLDESYDFTPTSIKERRKFIKVASALTYVGAVVFVLLLVLASLKALTLLKNIEEVERTSDRIRAISVKIARGSVVGGADIGHLSYYLQELYRSRRENPLLILPYAVELLREFEYKTAVLGIHNNKAVLVLDVEKRFGDRLEMNLFLEKIKERLRKYRSRGVEVKIGEVKKDTANNLLKFALVVEREL
jgi:hypothetical protein